MHMARCAACILYRNSSVGWIGIGVVMTLAVQAAAMSLNGSHEGMQVSAIALQGECSGELTLRTVTAHGVVPYEAILRAEVDLVFLERAAVLADSSAGMQPYFHVGACQHSSVRKTCLLPCMEPHSKPACWCRSHAATSQLSMCPGVPARAGQRRGLPACAGSKGLSACAPDFPLQQPCISNDGALMLGKASECCIST